MRLFNRKQQPSQRRSGSTVRLAIEGLEQRITPTTYTWEPTTSDGLAWGTGANWSPVGVPGAADNVLFNDQWNARGSTSPNCLLPSIGASVTNMLVSTIYATNGVITLQGGTLTVGSLTFNRGQLTCNANSNLEITGASSSDGGNILGTSTAKLNFYVNGGSMTFGTSFNTLGVTLNVGYTTAGAVTTGTVTWNNTLTGDVTLTLGCAWYVSSQGTLILKQRVNLTNNASGGNIHNYGTVNTQSGASGTSSTIEMQMLNYGGTINIEDSVTLNFTDKYTTQTRDFENVAGYGSSVLNLKGTCTFGATGPTHKINILGGTMNALPDGGGGRAVVSMNGNLTVANATADLSASAYGAVTVSGTMTLNGGTVYKTEVDASTMSTCASLACTGNATIATSTTLNVLSNNNLSAGNHSYIVLSARPGTLTGNFDQPIQQRGTVTNWVETSDSGGVYLNPSA